MQRLMFAIGFLVLVLNCPSVQAELNSCNEAPLTIEPFWVNQRMESGNREVGGP